MNTLFNSHHLSYAPALSSEALLLRACAVATQAHAHQWRKGAQALPYMCHPLQVAYLLAHEGGVQCVEILCAALLHDVLEDTTLTAAELETEFGVEISTLVQAVTDDKTLSRPEQQAAQIAHAPHLPYGAQLIKLADKISNIQDILSDPPTTWDRHRQAAYVAFAQAVVTGLRALDSPLLAYFDALVAEFLQRQG